LRFIKDVDWCHTPRDSRLRRLQIDIEKAQIDRSAVKLSEGRPRDIDDDLLWVPSEGLQAYVCEDIIDA
jgi:hypothetical protein